MKANKILFPALILLACTFTGCYEKFDSPAPQKTYTDADFSNIVPINTVKQIFLRCGGCRCVYGPRRNRG
ncbi:MAG: hypothetical protein L6V35_04415 [Alistipes putredinis]|nr:MAG: hypothetical protein L6V35_04415 [Alistipes putredinis]